MHVVIAADDGDRVSIHVDGLAVEQAVVRLELDNPAYSQMSDFDCVSLSVEQARELGRALIMAAEVVDLGAEGLFAPKPAPPARLIVAN
jgi:hypothetical protein